MVSTLNLDEILDKVRRNYCFYLDIQDHGLARSLSRRIQDMGFQQEVFLTSRVSHVVRDRPAGIADAGGASVAACARAGGSQWARREWRARADAMLDCVRRAQLTHTQASQHRYILLTVQKAINLLDNLYDTFFAASRKAHVTIFTKHFIKIEFLDKLSRPIYKEFDEWPEISLEPNSSKEKKKETPEDITNTATQKMTRKSRPRNKEREEKEPKGGYCEMCNTDYVDAALHRRSPHHLAFVRDRTNFLALDSLIGTGNDVTTFLDKATSINGERRSQRKMCNGDIEQPKNKRSKGPQSPDSTMNGNLSPKRNGRLDDERKHNTRCSKKVSETQVEDRQYYKVVGVSTKLRSSGGFANKRKDSPPVINGTKPLVVKFRKVRRSELSVLSDEAEQFMFPKRASSTSSTSSDDDKEIIAKLKSSLTSTPITNERRRQARPLTLKEESSEGESTSEDKRKRKRRVVPVAKRTRRVSCKPKLVRKTDIKETPVDTKTKEVERVPAVTISPSVEEAVVSSSRDEPPEGCMKWEDGKLKYTPAVEQLEFAFESVPRSEPWFETFKRQDEDKTFISNVPQYFSLYSKSPKLPYEIGQLPPLKANCCPLSDLVKREEKPGPSRPYGTRGMKNQKIRKRTSAVIALESHPRKSPREHASTLAILGSAGLLHRRRHIDDSKSTASEDTVSDAHSNMKIEPVPSETQEASERLQQFLSEVFDDAAEYEVSEDAMDGDVTFTTSTYVPDVSSLVSECENCDLITKEIKAATDRPRGKRGKFKKRNRTGWPKKRRQKKSSRDSTESEQKVESSLDRSSAEPLDDDTTQDTISEEDTNQSETEKDETTIERSEDKTLTEVMSESSQDKSVDSDEKTLINISKMQVQKMSPEKPKRVEEKEEKKSRCSDGEDKEERELRRNKRILHGLGEWLQPVVRVARVDPAAARRLRSAARPRTPRVR